MSPGYRRIVDEDRRLRIVQLLAENRGYKHNADVVRAALAALGHDVRIDETLALLDWLASAGLVETVDEGPPRTARLTERGVDLAERRIVVRGVALPKP